jgi:hypothetical protein
MRSLVITLCGSNRFEEYFKAWNKALSLAGHCVFTTSTYPSFENGVKDWHTPAEKDTLDAVHLRKIDLGGIVGETTITACVRDYQSVWAAQDQWNFVLADSRPLPFRPLKGALGFFEVPDHG